MARIQRLRTSAPRSTPMVLWGLVAYLVINLGHLMIQEYRLLYQGHVLDRERRATEQKALELETAIAQAKTPMGLERLARKNLAMTRPGEEPVRFVAPEAATK